MVKSKTINVIPSKHIYDALIQDINLNQAISDLIDNAIDNWTICQMEEPLEIFITIEENKIEIKDNSGGIDLDTLPLLLMPGGTNRGGGEGIKGIWGVGSKRALFSLGNKITILTRKKGENGLKLKVDESWFKNDEGKNKWELKYREESTLEEGITRLIIENLKIIINSISIREIEVYLAYTYQYEIEDGNIMIFLNEEKISLTPAIPWAKSKYAFPSRYITELPVLNTTRKLNIEITAGVMLTPGEDYSYGIDFIGNNRAVLQNNLDWRMGFDKERLGHPHPTINRFKAVVRVKGDSKDIPWNSAKSDINPNHPMYVQILDFVVQVSRQYTSFLRKNYDVTSKLFKKKATVTDIKNVIIKSTADFYRVVSDYEEEKMTERISFEVLKDDFNELVKHFNLQSRPKNYIGKFIFDKILGEVRGIDED